MIECVTLENCHLFSGNPICEQHRLRHESIVKRQNWNVPVVRSMEFDRYDNPAAYYLVKRGANGKAIGSSRLCPTDHPYMLEEIFPHLVNGALPKDSHVWEGSRFCVDASLPVLERQRTAQELVVGYLEFSLEHGIKNIIGVMYPIYWKNLFIKSGWNVEWLGDVFKSEEGHKIIAGNLKVTKAVLNHVRATTGISYPVLNFGADTRLSAKAA